jgi:arylsulfatase A-like enzyme
VYEGGLLVPAILEWPSRIPKPRITKVCCNTSDIYPTLLEIAGVTVEKQPVLDGISLVQLIEGKMETRKRPMGFWDYRVRGIGTPSAKWMGDLLKAQQAGEDLEPHESSQRAAQLPSPPYPLEGYTGHAAWIDGDWKLHRITSKTGEISWQLYNLADDPAEKSDLAATEGDRVAQMQAKLEAWLESVVRSLNGEDYAGS